MQDITLSTRIIAEEKETYFHIEGDKVICDSMNPKYFNKCLKQGWVPVKRFVYKDGTVCGMVLEAPAKSLSIRNAKSKKRVLTDEQKKSASERMKLIRRKQ